jgi:hypothetical protein
VIVPHLVRRRYHPTPWTTSTFALSADGSSIERLERYLAGNLAISDGWFLGRELNIRERVSSLLAYTAICILHHPRSVLSNLALGRFLWNLSGSPRTLRPAALNLQQPTEAQWLTIIRDVCEHLSVDTNSPDPADTLGSDGFINIPIFQEFLCDSQVGTAFRTELPNIRHHIYSK